MAANSHSTSVFNAPIIHLSSVDSTNNYAAKLIKIGKVTHGTVILADEQTNGRGQRSNSWISDKGRDLTFSLVLIPQGLTTNGLFGLNQVASQTIKEVIDELGGRNVCVKWPNDIMVGSKKIAGILIENSCEGERVGNVIVGIGLNVGSGSRDSVEFATSLQETFHREFNIQEILESFLNVFYRRYEFWRAGGYSKLELGEALWRKGVWTDFVLDAKRVMAKPLAVNDIGQIVVELQDGTINAFGTERLRHSKV